MLGPVAQSSPTLLSGSSVRACGSAISTACSGWLVPQLMIALPCPGSARLAAKACSVLQEGDVVRVQVGGDPMAEVFQAIDAQYRRRVFDL